MITYDGNQKQPVEPGPWFSSLFLQLEYIRSETRIKELRQVIGSTDEFSKLDT